MRIVPALLLALLIAPTVWLRSPLPVPDYRERLRITRLAQPSAAARSSLGAFRLEGVWRLSSTHAYFGGYSALAPMPDGQLLAVSDRGHWLRFSPPGGPDRPPRFGAITYGDRNPKASRDIEAAAFDPQSGTLWLAWEWRNQISRHGPGSRPPARVRPAAMRGWGSNSGPEAMARLADGRFLVLREGFDRGRGEARRHQALLFIRDPIAAPPPMRFTFDGPRGFSPTDAAQLPDGRVLVLMRRLVWPMPYRFVGRMALADPADIRAGKVWRARQVARLNSLLPVDNFEGLAIVPRLDGTVTLWMISDDNDAVTQRTLLWKLALDPAALRPAGTSKGAEGRPPAP